MNHRMILHDSNGDVRCKQLVNRGSEVYGINVYNQVQNQL